MAAQITEETLVWIEIGEEPTNLPSTNKDSSKSGLTHSLTNKLDEKNFLLWNQHVNVVITTHNLHRFVVNPEIQLQYAFVTGRLDGKSFDEYQRWIFKDQTLFMWLLSTISELKSTSTSTQYWNHELVNSDLNWKTQRRLQDR
jgi:hypothetical protein